MFIPYVIALKSRVPLCRVTSTQIAYLHIEMNCAPPEIAAIEYSWDTLVAGAPILLDDYAYLGLHPAKACHGCVCPRTWRRSLFAPDRSGPDLQAAAPLIMFA